MYYNELWSAGSESPPAWNNTAAAILINPMLTCINHMKKLRFTPELNIVKIMMFPRESCDIFWSCEPWFWSSDVLQNIFRHETCCCSWKSKPFLLINLNLEEYVTRNIAFFQFHFLWALTTVHKLTDRCWYAQRALELKGKFDQFSAIIYYSHYNLDFCSDNRELLQIILCTFTVKIV